MRRRIRYSKNPLGSYKIIRLGRLQFDEITGKPTYERYLGTDMLGRRCDVRDPGSWDFDPRRS